MQVPVVDAEHGQGDHARTPTRGTHGRTRGTTVTITVGTGPGGPTTTVDVTRGRDPASLLERWYAEHGRHDLPGGTTRDRWPILVSEVMLQQTQVPRVAEAWPEFIGRFPTAGAMAAAGPGAVITAWGRLGYPRRARRLWEAATVIAERRAGPTT